MKLDVKPYEEKMKKTVAGYEHELSVIRVGRANPAVLDKITIDYYGTPTPINQMAEIKITEARTMLIMPWDASALKLVEKAINASDIGITPMNDGKSIKLNFPALTEDRRRELTKQVAKMGEDAKVALRNIRRDANKKVDAEEKDSAMTEDQAKDAHEDVQTLLKKFEATVETLIAAKTKEIMEV